ncbi:nuclear transport factor 2 family protein [Cryptosporangium japonicum]|uniref:SnoaL-like domain-containing protein n=1 Tax=Cryptosporangium japonicum TaxID=80872 RepID=A0ABN0V0C4_9ACTN
MSQNIDTVNRYLDGFRTSDHEQVLSCLTDDITWTLFGGFRLQGKQAYDAEIENPAFKGSPKLDVIRLVEQDDVVMGELSGEGLRADGSTMRMIMAETWVMENGLIKERRSYVVELKQNDYQ